MRPYQWMRLLRSILSTWKMPLSPHFAKHWVCICKLSNTINTIITTTKTQRYIANAARIRRTFANCISLLHWDTHTYTRASHTLRNVFSMQCDLCECACQRACVFVDNARSMEYNVSFAFILPFSWDSKFPANATVCSSFPQSIQSYTHRERNINSQGKVYLPKKLKEKRSRFFWSVKSSQVDKVPTSKFQVHIFNRKKEGASDSIGVISRNRKLWV